MERARVVERGQLSKSSVHRLLKAAGISSRPPREARRERRAFLPEHASDLWMGDALHGPRVRADGRVRKAYLLSVIDAATRFVLYSQFFLSEGVVDHEPAFKHAIYTAGLPRAYYVDRGSAYRARSLTRICGELGIQHILTKQQDAEAKGAIERWHRTWREEVFDELPEEPLPLDELNAIHWAWLRTEYHARVHSTTQRPPLEHWLAQGEFLRAVPRGISLEEVFLRRAYRTVRKDGTVRFFGSWIEVPGELVGERIELRYDPSQPDKNPMVYKDGAFFCDTRPLDRVANADAKRRTLPADPEVEFEPTGLDPLALIVQEHYDLVRPAGVELVRGGCDMTPRTRFGLKHLPLPKDCHGKTFFDQREEYQRLARVFAWMTAEPGIAVLVGESGTGKTCAMRNLCHALPRPEHKVVYLCDTSVSALDVYRALATALGLRPAHRRGQLIADLKRAIVHLVNDLSQVPVLVIDESQHLSDDFLRDLASFVNFDFDSRDYITLWLVGLPPLIRRLRMQHHAALARRVVSWNRFSPCHERAVFKTMIEHGLKSAGAKQRVVADPALELLFRASRGLPRVAANVLRSALVIAADRDQSFVDEHVMHDAIVALSPDAPSLSAPKSLREPGTKSR